VIKKGKVKIKKVVVTTSIVKEKLLKGVSQEFFKTYFKTLKLAI